MNIKLNEADANCNGDVPIGIKLPNGTNIIILIPLNPPDSVKYSNGDEFGLNFVSPQHYC